jgi:nitrate/nitrite transporter NarK
MGGTAISALTTVKLVNAHGTATPFVLTAIVLAAYAVLAWLVLRDAPNRPVPSGPLATRLAATLRLKITWQASVLYAVAFGGYVAFSVYLPAYLKTGCRSCPAGHWASGTARAVKGNGTSNSVTYARCCRPAAARKHP